MSSLENFLKLGVSAGIIEALQTKGFEEPTPIQTKIIPYILESERDLIGQAQTGTGKTAAFGIPIIEKLTEHTKNTQVLILVPTRELAIQVSEEINSFKGGKNLHIIPVYGGQAISQQLMKLKKGVDIVVGTPGRIIDHLRRKSLNLKAVRYVVLDEADEMLNMGFIDDIKSILSNTNDQRTTYLFSATMPREILDVARKYMKDYDKIAVIEKQATVELTDQIYFEVKSSDKFEALCRIIDIEDDFYGLVFCRTKVDVDKISSHLVNRGYDAGGLHGDISQGQRENILNKFRQKKINILVATDVAARGIDIQNLTHVINYAIPQDPEAYVHRIGRTGRAGKEGTAITFITPEEYRKLMFIKKAARTDIRKEKVPQIKEVIDAKRSRIKTEIEQLAGSDLSQNYLSIARELLEDNEPETVLAAMLKFSFQNELNPENYNQIRDTYPEIKGKTRLFVAKGKKDKMTKRKLVEFIKNQTGIDDRKIDSVEVLDIFSFITVPFKEAEIILQSFKKFNKGKRAIVEVAGKSRTPGKRKRRR